MAFGAALLLSAPAIVAYLVVPTVWSAMAGSLHALSGMLVPLLIGWLMRRDVG